MYSCRGKTAVILGLAFLLTSSLATATTFLRADVPTLARASSSVVRARVENVQSSWNGNRSMIFTQVTLNVAQTLRGTPSSRVVVRVPGGTVNGYTIRMEGAPQFQTGSEVVAFIGSWDDGAAKVVGYAQGVSQLVRDGVGNLILRGGSADGTPLGQFVQQLARSGGAQ